MESNFGALLAVWYHQPSPPPGEGGCDLVHLLLGTIAVLLLLNLIVMLKRK